MDAHDVLVGSAQRAGEDLERLPEDPARAWEFQGSGCSRFSHKVWETPPSTRAGSSPAGPVMLCGFGQNEFPLWTESSQRGGLERPGREPRRGRGRVCVPQDLSTSALHQARTPHHSPSPCPSGSAAASPPGTAEALRLEEEIAWTQPLPAPPASCHQGPVCPVQPLPLPVHEGHPPVLSHHE